MPVLPVYLPVLPGEFDDPVVHLADMTESTNPASTANTETLSFSVTLDLKRKIRAEADRRLQTVSQFSREAILDQINAAVAPRGGRR